MGPFDHDSAGAVCEAQGIAKFLASDAEHEGLEVGAGWIQRQAKGFSSTGVPAGGGVYDNGEDRIG